MVALGSRGLGGKAFDLRPRLLFSQPHIVERLQVHPELRTRAEPVSETQRSVAGDRTLAINDLAEAICGLSARALSP